MEHQPGTVDGAAAVRPAAADEVLEATPLASPHRTTRRLALALVAAIVLVGGLVAVDLLRDDSSKVTTNQPAGVGQPGTWTQVDDLPIASRNGMVSAWTGDQLLVFGGYEALCPPDAECFGLGRTFADGAALDPAAGTWRRIADAPIRFMWANPVVIDGLVYLWAMEDERPIDIEPNDRGPGRDLDPSGDAAFLRYDPAADEWTELPHPFPGGEGYQLAAAGTDLVLNPSSDEGGSQPVRRFDPETQTWDILPDDPLPRLFDRRTFSNGGDLFLFGEHLLPAGSLGKEPTLAARLDLATLEWQELPDTGLMGDTYPVDVGETLVATDPSPNIRGEDPGPARVFDPGPGTWTDLPTAPTDPSAGPLDQPEVQGFLSETGIAFPRMGGLGLDLRDGTFHDWPQPPRTTRSTGRTVTSAGTSAVGLGGADWDAEGRSTPRQDVWIWLPPA